mmetsp:Transcript_4549/g.8288  ORF Transcript_4549/g.8288 Transcript_4549/m.8288 type:complete len:701 (-) Transcript_4549:289-2391(-)|eukprot:CAMPEP_0197519558 /NCGR_PEP_ID=MMETSP1318-20131121/4820_1 /TAXON_ID=552666 /ORGANISM="Partenskyella glossopodia, Strain RCC365" /LENGTH=700 /DNA_ID=CAMNT_0043070601 /DNA_START=449 /DNA_END=2551 /DNA_ORIENTATION=+
MSVVVGKHSDAPQLAQYADRINGQQSQQDQLGSGGSASASMNSRTAEGPPEPQGMVPNGNVYNTNQYAKYQPRQQHQHQQQQLQHGRTMMKHELEHGGRKEGQEGERKAFGPRKHKHHQANSIHSQHSQYSHSSTSISHSQSNGDLHRFSGGSHDSHSHSHSHVEDGSFSDPQAVTNGLRPRPSDRNSEPMMDRKEGRCAAGAGAAASVGADSLGSDDYTIEIRGGGVGERKVGGARGRDHSADSAFKIEEKNRIMQEQATRRAAINKEQQNILAMMEKEDAFWKKQEDRFKLMVKRQNIAKRTSDELQQFLHKWNKVISNLAQGHRNLTQYGREETGTLRQACIAQGILCKSLADHYSEMRERISIDTGKDSNDLTKNMFSSSKQLEASGKRLSKVIKTARSKCMDSWVAYAKAVQERQRLEVANKPVTRDPFVACRLYDRDVAALRKQEMQYRKEMTRLFRDFKTEDGRRIDKTQSIMLDYLLAQKAMLEDGIKFTESAIEAVKGVDREADVNEFIHQADLVLVPPSSGRHLHQAHHSAHLSHGGHVHDSKVRTPSGLVADNVFEIQPPLRDPKTLTRLYNQECQCQGSLHRQGKYLKSSWKKTHVVLSRSGFFHQFDSKNQVQPEVSIMLKDCQVNLAPKEDPCAFEIIEASRGFSSFLGGPTRHYYKAESEEELVDWMIAIKKHIPESKIEINHDT